METLISLFSQFGIEGVVIGVAFGIIVWMLKSNKEERKELRVANDSAIESFTASVDKNTEAINHNSEISVEIVTMLRERR